MLMAVLLNEIHNKYFKKVSQTLMFLPYFISQVLVGFLVFNLLNYDTGFINGILVKLGMEKWQPYSDKSVWPPILIAVYLWQVTGYNSVVYFASICGIDTFYHRGSKSGRRKLFPEDSLHYSAKSSKHNRYLTFVRTWRYRKRKLRSVLQHCWYKFTVV